MKDFLTKYFGVLGLLIYYPIAFVIRIPVGVFLTLWITVILMVVDPIIGKDICSNWVNKLYDWYCGR